VAQGQPFDPNRSGPDAAAAIAAGVGEGEKKVAALAHNPGNTAVSNGWQIARKRSSAERGHRLRSGSWTDAAITLRYHAPEADAPRRRRTVSLSRRSFLGAAALSPLGMKAFAAPGKFPTRAFGSTGVQVPILAFGCGSRFVGYKDDDEAVGVLSRAIDLGFTYVDTANNYGNGKSEERVGKLMPTRRGEVFLQTKIAARKGDEARRQLEASLGRLKTDHLDVLHIHALESLDDLAAIEAPDGVLKVVQQAKEQKLARFIGITGHASPAAMQAALERHDFDCVQMALNVARARMTFDDKGPHPVPMKDESYEALALPVAVRKKMGIVAMKVFGQDQLLAAASPEKLLYYALSLPVSLATVGMPRPELVEKNAALARAFAPLDASQMQSLRASVDDATRSRVAQFFARHRDA